MLALIQQNFGFYVATLVMWGFLMAFLFNLVKKSAAAKSDTTLMLMSLALFLSYLLADPLLSLTLGFEIFATSDGYFVWALFDFLTVLVIFFISKNRTLQEVPAKLYVFTGLSTNMAIFLVMYVDIQYSEPYVYWWFWDFYTVTVNLIDIMMLIALFSNKDFLGLVKLYRKVRGQAELA